MLGVTLKKHIFSDVGFVYFPRRRKGDTRIESPLGGLRPLWRVGERWSDYHKQWSRKTLFRWNLSKKWRISVVGEFWPLSKPPQPPFSPKRESHPYLKKRWPLSKPPYTTFQNDIHRNRTGNIHLTDGKLTKVEDESVRWTFWKAFSIGITILSFH